MVVARYAVAVLVAGMVGLGGAAHGQSVDVGGRAYVDYFYNFEAPTAEAEDLHGFRYRRLYLTTDFVLSEAFDGRARLEANDGTVGPDGPAPIVKDLWLRWTYSGGHSATLGVTPPPAFGLAEDVWGYRSLNKTILDQQGIVSSRDFGLRLDGPVGGTETVRYAVMLANNSGVRPETDTQKRVYGQLSVRPTERVLLVAGADYAGYDDVRDHGTRVSTFAGYSTEPVRVGLEAYWYRAAMRGAEARTSLGASLFGVLRVAPSWEVIARLDRSRTTMAGPDRYDTLVIGGLAYRPHPNVRLIPNLRVADPSEDPADTTGRFTVEVQF